MTSAISNALTILATFLWGDRTIHLLSSGRMVAHRTEQGGWTPNYCTTRSRGEFTGEDGAHCDTFTCDECWVTWSPGSEFPAQGTVNQWHMNQVSTMQAELDIMRHKVEHEMIEIAHVQQVAHDYAIHGEWCSVYEQAMETLSRVSGKDVPPLDNSTDITFTLTLNMTVGAERRQRIGDIDFLRQSLRHWAIEEYVTSFDPFDSDFNVTDVSVASVEIEEGQ
jgi:hypothetical protein